MRYSWMMILGLLCAALPAQAETMPINLHLTEYYDAALQGNASVVSVWVEDDRPVPALGRELKGKAILPRQPMDMVLRNALVGSLRTAGFKVSPVQGKDSINMLVHIRAFTYAAEDGFVTSKASLTSRVTVRVSHGAWHVERSLSTSAEHTVPFSPDAEKIEELVNGTLEDTLRAILQDDQIRAALRGEPMLSD